MSFNGYSFLGNKNGAFHERLAYYIIKKNKRMDEITKAIGVSAGSITFWCQGRAKPSFENIDRLCSYLDISINALRVPNILSKEKEPSIPRKKDQV